MNKPFTSTARTVCAALSLIGALGAVTVADASVDPTQFTSNCQAAQTKWNVDMRKQYAQLVSNDPYLQAVSLEQPHELNNMPWSGSFGGGCLDILPSGISLTLTMPTMEEIIEMLMKQVAKQICDKVRGMIGGKVNEFTNTVQQNSSFSYGGLSAGAGTNVSRGGFGMPAKSGVVQPRTTVAPQTPPVSQRLAPVVVTGSGNAAAAPVWNPNGAAPAAPQSSVAQPPVEDGFFSSTSRKVSCWFGGSCQ